MIGRLTRYSALAAAAILTAQPAAAQERFRVLVPDFYPTQGAKRNFGRDAAEELRKMLNTLRTHAPIDRKELADKVDEFDMKMEELDCLKTRQLASQINAQIALCANYTETGETREVTGVQFWDMTNGEALDVAAITATGRPGITETAQKIYEAFDRMVQLARAQQFCAEYAISQQWENSLTNCNQALELNPGAIGTRLRKANVYFQWAREEGAQEAQKKERFTNALAELDKVLEVNQFHEDALQLAGFVAIQLGDEERGRGYYNRYLEVNPGADQVRLNIAFDMAEAGDPEGAMALIKQGLAKAPENTGLLTSYATYAYSAADKRMKEARAANDAQTPPAALALYREVVDNLNKVAAIQGAETPAQNRRTVIASYMQLGEATEAERVAREVLAKTADDKITMSFLADALHRQGKLDEAVATVTQLGQMDPSAPAGTIEIRQANWLLDAGRNADALPYFRKAVERGMSSNDVARMIFADAVNKGVRRENWNYAITGLQQAKQFEVTPETKSELDFWHGWSLYYMGMGVQKPQTLESARESLPIFEQARGLFESGRGHAGRAGVNIQQLLNAVNQYIEIQQVIIRRYG